MRSKILMLLMFAASAISAQTKLTVTIDSIENLNGQILIAVFDSENFMKMPVAADIQKIDRATLTFTFDSIEAGEYAITVFQDENLNYKLDLDENGIPTEKWGFSNNFQPKGAPTFADCKITVKPDEETVEKITLN
ncbi:MAG: DUF2141 domain-containing protein [Prevotellaceae bacterium]|jgi:uncharacterized protein (DUF2141 family)|nr:DUF2141 domain-containing protein [Prevotellaceae bacterium]